MDEDRSNEFCGKNSGGRLRSSSILAESHAHPMKSAVLGATDSVIIKTQQEGNSHVIRIAISCCLALFLMSTAAFAQRITGSIEGRVTDSTGAVLPGVDVTVTNEATGQVRTTLTNESGLYSAPLLPSGTYSVRVTLAGFRSELRRGVQIEVDRNAKVDVQLEVGQVSESLEVVADAPLIQTDNSSLGQVIDRTR